MRILICDTHGGFGLSRLALHRLRKAGHPDAIAEVDIGETWPGTDQVRHAFLDSFLRDIDRTDPRLLALFDELGQEASGQMCHLKAVDVPDGTDYEIEEYDGLEWVAEKHRTWS